MATDNPRVAAYLQPVNYELLKAFSQEHGLSLSQGVDRIIAEYLGGSVPSQHTGSTLVKAEGVEGLEAFVEAIITARSQSIITQCQLGLREQMEALEANYLGELQYLREELQILQHSSTLVTLQKHTMQYTGGTPESTSSTPISNETLVGGIPEPTSSTPISNETLAGDTPESINNMVENTNLGLNQTQLAERLGVDKSVVSRHKNKEGFGEWSKSKASDGIAWRYDEQSKLFYQVGRGENP